MMQNIKKILSILTILVVTIIISVYINLASQSQIKNQDKANKLLVITTLFPVYDFTKQIGGDKINAKLLLPEGSEPHTFEPKPEDVRNIMLSDVLFYTSDIMEPWVKKINLGNANKPQIVNLSDKIDLHEENHEEEIDHVNEAEHNYEGLDPHYWLDIENAKIMSDEIFAILSTQDKENAKYYENNLNGLKLRLNKLSETYFEELKSCKLRKIYHAGHFAFGYLADRYGLDYEAIQGLSPESDINAQDIVGFVKQINLQNVKTIFYEEVIDPKISKVIINETGAKMLVLNAVHNVSKSEIERGITYSDIMNTNLDNLRLGLDCK